MIKTILFRVIAISLPFLLIGILELSLRMMNYGHSMDLFIEYGNNKEFLTVNPSASERFFPNKQFASVGNQELFKKEKDPQATRIFVLGESTTIGYPYFHNGSFHRWLLYRLSRSYPDKQFEVINLALTAVNSFTIYGFAKELVDYKPDAVLIYTGHNEYYGGLGVGSTQTIGGNPALVNRLLSIRHLRTVQLLFNISQRITNTASDKEISPNATRMELMVKNQQIPYKSKLYKKGINQFSYNMNATLQLFNKNKIPVFIGNLFCNIKDLPPFISSTYNCKHVSEFSKYYNGGLAALKQKDTNAALSNLKAANAICPTHAMCNYLLGKIMLSKADYKTAGTYLRNAKEYDELRFRAPEDLNTIITDLSVKYPNVHVVDIKGILEKQSENNLPGDAVFTDHVHPNLAGYYLMSVAFYNELKENKILPGRTDCEITDVQLAKEMPVSASDSLAGALRIINLKGRWPYNGKANNYPVPEDGPEKEIATKLFHKEIDWVTAQKNLYTLYLNMGQLEKAAEITEGVVLEYPYDPVILERTSMILAKSGNKTLATFYLKKSFSLSPSFEKAHYLFVFYLMMDNPVESLPYLDYAIGHNYKGLKLDTVKPLVKSVIAEKEKLSGYPNDVSIFNKIAGIYLLMENKDGALTYINKVLQIDPKNKQALIMRKQLI